MSREKQSNLLRCSLGPGGWSLKRRPPADWRLQLLDKRSSASEALAAPAPPRASRSATTRADWPPRVLDNCVAPPRRRPPKPQRFPKRHYGRTHGDLKVAATLTILWRPACWVGGDRGRRG